MPPMREISNINFILDRFCRINKKFCAPIIEGQKEGQIKKNYDSRVMVARSRIESLPPRADMNALVNCLKGFQMCLFW